MNNKLKGLLGNIRNREVSSALIMLYSKNTHWALMPDVMADVCTDLSFQMWWQAYAQTYHGRGDGRRVHRLIMPGVMAGMCTDLSCQIQWRTCAWTYHARCDGRHVHGLIMPDVMAGMWHRLTKPDAVAGRWHTTCLYRCCPCPISALTLVEALVRNDTEGTNSGWRLRSFRNWIPVNFLHHKQ